MSRHKVIRGKEDLHVLIQWKGEELDVVKGTEVVGDVANGSITEVRYKNRTYPATVLYYDPVKEKVKTEMLRIEQISVDKNKIISRNKNDEKDHFKEKEETAKLKRGGNNQNYKDDITENCDEVNKNVEVERNVIELEHNTLLQETSIGKGRAEIVEIPGPSESGEEVNLKRKMAMHAMKLIQKQNEILGDTCISYDSDVDCTYSPELDEMNDHYKYKQSVGTSNMEKTDDTPQKNSLHPTCRKRKRHDENYIDKLNKEKRTRGLEYVSRKSKKVVKAKEMGPDCGCRNKCYTRVSEDERTNIFTEYYNLKSKDEQTSYIFYRIVKSEPKRKYRKNKKDAPIKSRPKLYSFQYNLHTNNATEIVCRKAFCNILAITEKRLRYVRDQIVVGITTPICDRRSKNTGKIIITDEIKDKIKAHIASFPSSESHYSRSRNPNRRYLDISLNIKRMYQLFLEKYPNHTTKKIAANIAQEKENGNSSIENESDHVPVSEKSYRTIFNENFNLSFSTPKSDVCSICEENEIKLLAAPENVQIKNKLENHKIEANLGQAMLKLDYQRASTHENEIFISMDLQQAFPLPFLNVSEAFYCRKLWMYNLGIHVFDTRKGYMHLWTEDVARRGADEIGSCLLHFIKQMKNEKSNTEKLTIWSDSCVGQNKNFTILALEYELVNNGSFIQIDHKFPKPGHSMLPSDRDFGLIENEKKHNDRIYTPSQWATVIERAKRKDPYIISMLQSKDFVSVSKLRLKHNFLSPKQTLKTLTKEKFNIRDVAHFRVTKNKIEFKYSHSTDDWQEINIAYRSNLRTSTETMIDELPLKYEKKIPITIDKFNDLNRLMKYIPEVDKEFYTSLTLSNDDQASNDDE